MALVEDLLTSGGVPFRYADEPGEITLNCPFCVERGKTEDTGRKLGVNVRLFKAHCYRCEFKCRGFRRLLDELCRAYHLPRPTIRPTDVLEQEQAVEEDASLELAEVEPTGYPEGYESFTFGESDEVEQQARSYLEARGITAVQMGRHRIGFAAWGKYSYRVVFPVLGPDKQVYGFACRTFANQEPRYLNSPGVKLLWGAQRAGKVAIEVEGIMDGLAVERAVRHLPEVVPVAPLGSATTDLQLQQLGQFDSTVMFPDRDLAGVRGCIKRARSYEEHGLKVFVIIPGKLDEKDPGDLSPDEIRNELDRAVPWSLNAEHRLMALKEQWL